MQIKWGKRSCWQMPNSGLVDVKKKKMRVELAVLQGRTLACHSWLLYGPCYTHDETRTTTEKCSTIIFQEAQMLFNLWLQQFFILAGVSTCCWTISTAHWLMVWSASWQTMQNVLPAVTWPNNTVVTYKQECHGSWGLMTVWDQNIQSYHSPHASVPCE